jgi:hypothetical protein
MLSPLPRWIGIGGSVTSPLRFGLPRILGGSASTTFLSGPSQGSLALRPARSLQPYRLTSVPRASAGRSPYPTVWVATGMNRQFSARNFHPLASYALVAHQYVGVINILYRKIWDYVNQNGNGVNCLGKGSKGLGFLGNVYAPALPARQVDIGGFYAGKGDFSGSILKLLS